LSLNNDIVTEDFLSKLLMIGNLPKNEAKLQKEYLRVITKI